MKTDTWNTRLKSSSKTKDIVRQPTKERRARVLHGVVVALPAIILSQLTGCASIPAPSHPQSVVVQDHQSVTGTGEVLASETVLPCAADLADKRSTGHSDERFKDDWGIQILGIRQTAGGYMLDFRYRVVDSKKAQRLLGKETKPYLVDQASGLRMAVPTPAKVGALRARSEAHEGRTYFIIFANPGNYVKRGSKVAVVIGDFRADDLTVQ